MNQKALFDFIQFLSESPTAWHTVAALGTRLAQQNFTPLDEKEKWDLEKGESYFTVRGGSVCAFTLPTSTLEKGTLLTSHTDSPALKLKPHPLFTEKGLTFLRTETYGSPIVSTWLNRDLAIAGRIFIETGSNEIEEKLIFLDESPLLIPTLAIHLDRKQNETPLPLSKQEHLCPLVGIKETTLEALLGHKKIINFDLYLIPLESPKLVGSNQKLLASYRLDNLCSVHASLLSLLAALKQKHTLQMALFWNHEEIGSATDEGASSPFLEEVLKRISLSFKQDEETFLRVKQSSQMVSIDLAHAFHPQYKERYDKMHAPELEKGVVIKYHANHRYATTGKTAAQLIQTLKKHKLPFQSFASHSDLPSGSTVGTLAATRTGIPTVDIGIAQLSMHAAREIIATQDHHTLSLALKSVLEA